MAYVVPRPKLTLAEKLYLPTIVAGLAITWKHFKNAVVRKKVVTMQYPELRWDASLPEYYRGAPTLDRARLRRVARAAFFRTRGGSCVPDAWGLRLWNGRGEQMITVYFPNPWLDERGERVREPRWQKTALWEELRRRYAAPAV